MDATPFFRRRRGLKGRLAPLFLRAVQRLGLRAARRGDDASLHDQHGTSGEVHDAVRAAPDHALVQGRMSSCTDDEQIHIEIGA